MKHHTLLAKNFFLACLLFCHDCLAETCPSIHDIQTQALSGWKMVDSDDNTPLPLKRAAEFKKAVRQFALAEWTEQTYANGSVHCYYLDKHGSNLNAYLVKEGLAMKNPSPFWYQVSGSMNCAASPDKCSFNKLTIHGPTQLAKK